MPKLSVKAMVAAGVPQDEAKRLMVYSDLYFGESISGYVAMARGLEQEVARSVPPPGPAFAAPSPIPDVVSVRSNHSGYGYRGSESFEHDNTGDIMNYSGVYDTIISAAGTHEGWTPGYDYDEDVGDGEDINGVGVRTPFEDD